MIRPHTCLTAIFAVAMGVILSTGFLANAGGVGEKTQRAADEKLLGSDAAKLEGDPEYGQYLAAECTTCHNRNGAAKGIPDIAGRQSEEFIDALYRYKQGARENPVMRMIAKRLGDEEMAALAAYFGSLKP